MRTTTLIELDNLRKAYETSKNSVIALNNIDLTINNGEFVSIMDPSGSSVIKQNNYNEGTIIASIQYGFP